MKFRSDFVTNSSSSSFVVDKRGISATQLRAIENHIEVGKKLDRLGYGDFGSYDKTDEWYVRDGENNSVILSTYMDNFNMYSFLKAIGVSENNIYNSADEITNRQTEMNDSLLGDILTDLEDEDSESDDSRNDEWWGF